MRLNKFCFEVISISKFKTADELNIHRKNAVETIDHFLQTLINSNDPKLMGKADKLSYWLEDWVKFLDYEPQFVPARLRRYKRGEIIKIHLGFNIGSEEGGLHYAVVLDRNNAKTSPVVTVVPLTSVKPHTDIANLKSGCVFLGNELFTNLSAKVSSTTKHLQNELNLFQTMLHDLGDDTPDTQKEKILEQVSKMEDEIKLLERMRTEVSKMRSGSIALVNQITTVSKIRIYDPKTDHDILSNIKLSNEKLDALDEEINKKFTNSTNIVIDSSIK